MSTYIMQSVDRYVRRIRNRIKKRYAIAYYEFLLAPSLRKEPKIPTDLSFMAAQAVRSEIGRRIREELTEEM